MTQNKSSYVFCLALLLLVSPAARASDGDRCSPQIANNAAAAGVCRPVCAGFGMAFAGNWSNVPNHPPVASCIAANAGLAVCGCTYTTPAPSGVITPTVEYVDATPPPRLPIGLMATCLDGPDTLNSSGRCPVVDTGNGITFWALSYADNRNGMAIVGYDADGNVVSLLERTGALYVWDITVDATNQTITFFGQSNQTITLNWNDLFVPQIGSRTNANYVLWPTATSGTASWTNGAARYGTAAPFGAGANQLLDPYVEHAAGMQLCAAKQKPWFNFTTATVASPYSTVTCTQPPDPAQPTYNAAMVALLNAAVGDHSLMAALRAATTDERLIAVAASKGYTITEADIQQSRGTLPPTTRSVSARLVAAASSSSSCGNVDQSPCITCTQEQCVYWPFGFCCIEEACLCSGYGTTCASGLSVGANGTCQPACPTNQICKEFPVFYEYNDNGTAANGVCESWLSKPDCAKGIPNDALASYEVIFKSDGLAYYKSDNTLVNTWTGSQYKETLYVIDGRTSKIYLVNVDGRYIQVRGTANCIPASVAPGGSTANCTKPRLTTHAGILMGSVYGLPTPNQEPAASVQQRIAVIGAGTIQVTNGAIQWITNDSGHFRPTQDNLKNSIVVFKSAGFPNFPPLGDCTYDFRPVAGKTGVYRQDAITTTHCGL